MTPPTPAIATLPAVPQEADLAPTEFLDLHHEELDSFMAKLPSADQASPAERAIWLYRAVRDGIRYEVYGADLSRTGLRASTVVAAGSGMCLHKSVLFASCLRRLGIPSRLVLTDVRNHLASPRLLDLLGGEVFHQHCLTTLYLDGRWMRATPVFNRTLCRLYGLQELTFDATGDSVHHAFDRSGRRHMEFIREHGEFDDLPYDFVLADLRAAHPLLFSDAKGFVSGSLRTEAPGCT